MDVLPHLKKISCSKYEDIRVKTAALSSIDTIMKLNNLTNDEKFHIKSLDKNNDVILNSTEIESNEPFKNNDMDINENKKRKSIPIKDEINETTKRSKTLKNSSIYDFFKNSKIEDNQDKETIKDEGMKNVSKSILSFEPTMNFQCLPGSKTQLSSFSQESKSKSTFSVSQLPIKKKEMPMADISSRISSSQLSKMRTSRVELSQLEIEEHVSKLNLSEEQRNIVRKCLSGKNIFFTGSAGTGKSYTLRELISVMRLIYSYEEVFVTAPTGISACNINGSTIHSFAGIGLGKESTPQLLQKIIKNKNSLERWLMCSVLIIDEISMLSGELFDTLEEIARRIRSNDKPFGGIQVILCGDFFQLPPVSTATDQMKFCFQSVSWNKVVEETIILETVFRQKDDKFVKILNEMRKGKLSLEGYQTLKECINRGWNDEIEPTCLYSTKNQVAEHNKKCLDAIDGEEVEFEARDEIKINNQYVQKILEDSCAAPKKLSLKVGAQVILLKNIDTEKDLFNGARGIITDFSDNDDRYPIVKFENGIVRLIKREVWSIFSGNTLMATRYQIPLALAWALSIHKSQGMTISRLEVSLNRIFECGQAYVALSRAKSLEGLRINGYFDKRVIKAHEDVIKFYDTHRVSVK